MNNAMIEPSAARDVHFPLGAHIVTPRRCTTHHDIYVGAGQVVHYQGLTSSLRGRPRCSASQNARPATLADSRNRREEIRTRGARAHTGVRTSNVSKFEPATQCVFESVMTYLLAWCAGAENMMSTLIPDPEGLSILNDLLAGAITRRTAKKMYAALLRARGLI